MSTPKARFKLPRVPHADRPRPGEVIRKRGGADLQNGWLARHGTLYLTDERLVFVPTLLDTALRARRREILLDDLIEVERVPRSPGTMNPGGRRTRLHMHTRECIYVIMMTDCDAWLDAIEAVIDLRNRRGLPHRPTFTRDTDNLLKALREES